MKYIIVRILIIFGITNLYGAEQQKSWLDTAKKGWESLKSFGAKTYGIGKAPEPIKLKNSRYDYGNTYWETLPLDKDGIPVTDSYNNTSHKVKYEAAIHPDTGRISYIESNNKRNTYKSLKEEDVPLSVRKTAEWYLQERQDEKAHNDSFLNDLSQNFNQNLHKSRYEGARNAALLGAGAAAVGAAGYGLYQLYNWYRGNLHALKQHIKAAEAAIGKAVKSAEKENVQGSNILITDIHNAKETLKKIYQSIEQEELRRKTAKRLIN